MKGAHGETPSAASSTGAAIRGALALAALNALLAFENWWPTPAIQPDHRIAPEAVGLWLLLLWWARRGLPVTGRRLAAVTAVFAALVVGRYFDVTAPALFGRGINLYWDAPQIPRFLWVSATALPAWVSLAAVAATLLVASLLWLGARALIASVARHAAPRALGSRTALAATGVAVAASLANLAGIEATWPWIAKPVTPTYARQAALLAHAWHQGLAGRQLPPSPRFDGDLAALGGADVRVVMLESYGAIAFDDPAMREGFARSRARWQAAIEAAGLHVVSGFYRSPTYGGASDLAHLSLLSGIDLSDPWKHDLLLTTDRPTLLTHFARHGYETWGVYPALSWEWPERAFYRFERFLDGPGFEYRGPHLGFWWIPDQVAADTLERRLAATASSRPRFVFFATITVHLPFGHVPPYQPDWARLAGEEPFERAELERALADRPDWLNMRPGYRRGIDYTYAWLAGWIARPRPRETVWIFVGDHQPTANVTGPGARWDVPVHVVARDPALLARLRVHGLVDGLEPAAASLGGLHDLTRHLLAAFQRADTPLASIAGRRPGAAP